MPKKKWKKKRKKKENIEKYFDHMKTVKNSIKNIIKPKKFSDKRTLHNILQDAVYRTNKIIIHTYNFIKLYILYLYEKNEDLPIIDKMFVKIITRIVSTRNDKRGGKPNQKYLEITNELIKFYNEYYRKSIDEIDITNDDKLASILSYECEKIVTCIDTNIKEHFIDHFRRLINIKFNLKDKISKINSNKKLTLDAKKELRNKIYEEFRNIKNDILNVENDELSSPEKYHGWIEKNKYSIIPEKESYSKNSVYYDVKCSPQDYLKGMIFINKKLNKLKMKLFNVLPLKTRIIPGYVTIDTNVVSNLLMKTDPKKYRTKIIAKKKKIWAQAFNTDKKVFKKKGYVFNGMIQTDGVACSILFVKADRKGNPIKISKAKKKQMKNKKEIFDNKYIEHQPNIKKTLKGKNYVCIDPNLSDLMYCMDKEGNKFRYTQNQRRLETRKKKYANIIDKINSRTMISEITFKKIGILPVPVPIPKKKSVGSKSGKKKTTKVIPKKKTKKIPKGRTVKQIESDLSSHNSKTCDFVKFLKYLKVKNRVNRCLFKQYQDRLYRKLKWNSFINTQKSESKMLSNFQNKFGSPEETNVIIGDYDKINNPKGKESCLTKGLRKLLRDFGYNLFLINEFRTSKLCNNCHECVENFKFGKSKKPWNEGEEVLVWGPQKYRQSRYFSEAPRKLEFHSNFRRSGSL